MSSTLGPFSVVLLIFGGCCSNVFALEAIIRSEPQSGLLITFFQFVTAALAGYPSQYSSEGAYSLRPSKVPVRKWALIGAMHLGVNVLNNWAFAYDISVPVHIILRSFGSVTTMLAGRFRGKTFSPLQVFSVSLLTVGVFISGWADAQSKGKSMSMDTNIVDSGFAKGLSILLGAQFMSAYMSVYTQDAYAEHGASWTESLFYSHFLCLPLFLPFSGALTNQYNKLAATDHLDIRQLLGKQQHTPYASSLRPIVEALPQGLFYLTINIVTQLVCISGVNLLSVKTSAVTITIVLNIRKLFSFILSTIIFGHRLGGLIIFGSTVVFGSGALYGWETSWRLPREEKESEKHNGNLKSTKKRAA